MVNKISVVIADDERPARMFLISLLKNFEEISIVGEASNGIEALGLIEQLKPDLIFLDVQMPGLDGFEVVRSLKKTSTPIIVFVTAYDEYFTQAIELGAFDCLLKPVEISKLKETILRVCEYQSRGNEPVNRNKDGIK